MQRRHKLLGVKDLSFTLPPFGLIVNRYAARESIANDKNILIIINQIFRCKQWGFNPRQDFENPVAKTHNVCYYEST